MSIPESQQKYEAHRIMYLGYIAHLTQGKKKGAKYFKEAFAISLKLGNAGLLGEVLL